MILAQAKGKNCNITAYKKSIVDLIHSIEHVINEYKNQNKQHDLKVLLMNTKILQAYVNKYFKYIW